jgi:DNA modification methylase
VENMSNKTVNNDLKTVEVPISQLKPAEYNPRKWSEKATEDLTENIKKFGFVVPIVVNSAKNRKNIVIGGHFRLEIAKRLGYKKIPIIYVNIPDEKREKELNLRLNRNVGEWDFDLLKKFDVDLLMDVGFDDSDLGHIWDENLGVDDDKFDLEEEVKKIGKPKTKLGDIITLGVHRLCCGDSTDIEVVGKLVGSCKADMLNFDPIYNIGLDYNKGIGTRGKYGGKASDKKSDVDYRAFLKKVFQNGIAFCKSDFHSFCWCDQTYIGMLQDLYKELGIVNRRVCLWIKNSHNPTPQVAFNKSFESCVYGTKGKPYLSSVHNLNEILNKEIGTGNRVSDDIMDLFDIWLVKRVSGQKYEHPTQKPPTLYEKALRRCSKPGDIILDLFAGSGSQLVAAEQLKRRAFLCEIDPVFCDVIVERYKQLTGKGVKYVN